jgi:ketosteroid isomerase-like protein
MGEAEIQVVRAFIEFYGQGQTEAALALLDEHAVLDITRLAPPEVGVAFGHDAITQMVVRYVATFEQYDYEISRLADVGGGTVLAVITERGRGKGSGALVQRSYASLYNVIDGRVVRMTHFPTEREAFHAAGLST